MRVIENETGTYCIDDNGRLVHYEHTVRNGMQGSRHVLALNIPEGVQEIPDNAFRGYEVNHGVILPASLKQVGKYAFLGGHLDNVVLPKNPNSEMMCQLAHALRFVHTWYSNQLVQDWPRKYAEIYHGKGEPRESWWQLHNASGTFFVDSDGVLMDFLPEQSNIVPTESGKTALNLLHIPEGVVAINSEMFSACKVMQEITFPKSLRCIGVGSGVGNAFGRAELPDVVFPENLEVLGNFSFGASHFRSITVTGVSQYWKPENRRTFKDSVVGMIRVPMKFREVLDEACRGWEWSEGFEMTDPVLGQLYCVKSLQENLRRGDTVLRVLNGIAYKK